GFFLPQRELLGPELNDGSARIIPVLYFLPAEIFLVVPPGAEAATLRLTRICVEHGARLGRQRQVFLFRHENEARSGAESRIDMEIRDFRELEGIERSP